MTFSFTEHEKKIFKEALDKMDGATFDESPEVNLYVLNNNLEGIIWVYENIFPSWYLFGLLAYKGHIAFFSALRERDNVSWKCEDVFSFAIVGGQIEMVKWLINNGCPCGHNAICLAEGYRFRRIASLLKSAIP